MVLTGDFSREFLGRHPLWGLSRFSNYGMEPVRAFLRSHGAMTSDVPETVQCRRCKADKPALPRPPFRNELGERILESICRDCWGDWLQHQTLLINHYGLDPRDQKAKDFLYKQVEEVLLGDGAAEQVDTSQQGQVEW